MGSMLRSWIGDQRGDKVFLSGPDGRLTYGDLAGVAPSPARGQVIVRPGQTLSGVAELMTAPGPGRQVVILAPDLAGGEAARRVAAAREARDREAHTIVFTSGSTGPAKAVRLTEANWAAAAEGSATHLGHGRDDVWLAAMPLHHVGGLSILYRSARVGASVRWMPRFDPARFAEELGSQVTLASVVPTMLRRVLDLDEREYHGLKAVLVGGGPIPPGLLEEAAARGIPAVPTYGMTETCAQVATLRPGEPVRYAVEPLPGVELRIGDAGRVEVRGAQVSPGYADADDRSPDAWFVTPDLGSVDTNGYLRILGRADDVIVTGGENVNPGQVEPVLASHPEVTAVVVVGVPDPEWGQRVAALYTGSVDPQALADWARPRLAAWELPKTFRRVAALPLGASAKPDRSACRTLLA